jgi:hypothetical protein
MGVLNPQVSCICNNILTFKCQWFKQHLCLCPIPIIGLITFSICRHAGPCWESWQPMDTSMFGCWMNLRLPLRPCCRVSWGHVTVKSPPGVQGGISLIQWVLVCCNRTDMDGLFYGTNNACVMCFIWEHIRWKPPHRWKLCKLRSAPHDRDPKAKRRFRGILHATARRTLANLITFSQYPMSRRDWLDPFNLPSPSPLLPARAATWIRRRLGPPVPRWSYAAASLFTWICRSLAPPTSLGDPGTARSSGGGRAPRSPSDERRRRGGRRAARAGTSAAQEVADEQEGHAGAQESFSVYQFFSVWIQCIICTLSIYQYIICSISKSLSFFIALKHSAENWYLNVQCSQTFSWKLILQC